jgi:hypothetical protein
MVNLLEDWSWSSYLAIMGGVEVPQWLDADWILSQFATQRKIARVKYGQFVMQG